MRGTSISPVEVTNISQHGFWLLLESEELFLPSSNHLYWPDLDVDLTVESIHNPQKFPLVSQLRA